MGARVDDSLIAPIAPLVSVPLQAHLRLLLQAPFCPTPSTTTLFELPVYRAA
jgi:hypothetical protein